MGKPTILFVRRANCTTRMLLGKTRCLLVLGASSSPSASVATEKEERVLPLSITSSVHRIPTLSDLAPRQSLKGSSGMPSRMDVKLAAFVWKMVVQTRVLLMEVNATTIPRRKQTKISYAVPNLDLRYLPPPQERPLLKGSAEREQKMAVRNARRSFELARRLRFPI